MRYLWLLALALSPLLALAQSNPLESVLKALPACGRSCLVQGVQWSTCAATNVTCICTNEALTREVEACVAATCSVKNGLFTKNVTQTSCGAVPRDRTKHVSYIGVAGGIIAFIAVFLRLLARLPTFGGDWGWDDTVMIGATVTMIPLSSLSVVLANAGLGKDMWTVTPKDITHILYIYFFDESLYIASLSLVKISICCFYLRIFPERRFRWIVYTIIFFCAAYAITFVLAITLQCKPINMAWKRWDGEHAGQCISMNSLGWSSAAFNIALDLIVITLPLPQVLKLVLSTRKKFHVMCMFSVGLFVTIVSMLRLKWMIQFANSQNVTWDYVPIGYWSTIEVHAGILCACLPAMRALLYKACPCLVGRAGASTAGGRPSKGGYYHSSSYGSRSVGTGGAIDASTSIVQRVSKAGELEGGNGGGEWVKLDEVDGLEASRAKAGVYEGYPERYRPDKGVVVETTCYHAM